MSGDKGYLESLFSLQGKKAIITGAAGGIGSVLAAGFAEAGAVVALCDIRLSELSSVKEQIHEDGHQAQSFIVDLASHASILALVEKVKDELGGIDILVNCAATNQREPILDVVESTFDRIMNVNLRGLFQLSQAVAPSMIAAGGGKMIHIGSINSEMALKNVAVYGATKGAVKQLTMAMAVEWAAFNIQVNSIIPGFMRTPLSAHVWEDPVKSRWMLERIAFARPGEPDELLGMAIYLASRASSYVTGQSMIIDGGVSAGGSGW